MNILKAILSIFKKKEEAKVEEGCCGKQEVCCKFDEPVVTVEEPKAEEVKVEEVKVTAKEVKAKARKPKAPKVEEVKAEEDDYATLYNIYEDIVIKWDRYLESLNSKS
jgi:hypothetical protein